MRIASWAVLIALNLSPALFAQTSVRLPPQTTSGTGFTGAPYSAKETSVKIQTAADGTQRTATYVELLWRDASGRTRREVVQQDPYGAEYRSVIITDPIAGVYLKWTIGNVAVNKVATIWPLSEDQKITAPPPPRRIPSSNPAPAGNDPTCGCERLAPQLINGVYAEGSRSRRTVLTSPERGAQPVVVTNELWISPDLRIIMRHINDDPVEGPSTANVTDVVLGDPDPALFTAPQGYAIRDTRQSSTQNR
jgi:hypothetical protein